MFSAQGLQMFIQDFAVHRSFLVEMDDHIGGLLAQLKEFLFFRNFFILSMTLKEEIYRVVL